MSRDTRSIVTDVIAECRGCPWESTAGNALGNAARHHDASGHVVAVSITRLVTYGDPSATPPGQLTIEEAQTG